MAWRTHLIQVATKYEGSSVLECGVRCYIVNLLSELGSEHRPHEQLKKLNEHGIIKKTNAFCIFTTFCLFLCHFVHYKFQTFY